MTTSSEVTNQELEAQVTTWLRDNLPAEWIDAVDQDDRDGLAEARRALDVRSWWERLGAAGWFFSTWPVRYGGLGLNSHQAAVVNDVLRRYKVPRTDNPLGLNVSYALLRWGTEEQKHRFLEPIAKQREIWVQLFSEPGAGSDLAGLSTRAARDGEVWLVNGQKVWSSHVIAPTGASCSPGRTPMSLSTKGYRCFSLHMKSPGITVRPLKQMTGEAFFNEVFFDDVVCAESMRFGELGQGWQIASNLLSYERGAAAGGGSAAPGMAVGRSVELSSAGTGRFATRSGAESCRRIQPGPDHPVDPDANRSPTAGGTPSRTRSLHPEAVQQSERARLTEPVPRP